MQITNRKDLRFPEVFEIIDSVNSPYTINLKDSMHITFERPSFSNQVRHTSSISVIIFLLVVSFFTFMFCYYHRYCNRAAPIISIYYFLNC